MKDFRQTKSKDTGCTSHFVSQGTCYYHFKTFPPCAFLSCALFPFASHAASGQSTLSKDNHRTVIRDAFDNSNSSDVRDFTMRASAGRGRGAGSGANQVWLRESRKHGGPEHVGGRRSIAGLCTMLAIGTCSFNSWDMRIR